MNPVYYISISRYIGRLNGKKLKIDSKISIIGSCVQELLIIDRISLN